MSTNTLIQLPTFSYTSLDFDTIVEDVKTLIKQHPEYNEEWNDFLETNAGRMFVESMAYIVEKLASRMDWVAQEMFVSTATQRQSLINILKLINHRPYLPSAAKVNVTGKITKWVEPFTMTQRETIIGLDTDGNAVRFECIDNADDGKPDYSYTYTFATGTTDNRTYEFTNIPFYQGTTYTEDSIFMDGIDNDSFTLEHYPVIENSIRVYDYETGSEFIEVDSFISTDAQQNDLSDSEKVPAYMVEIDADNKATVKFGSSSLVTVPTAGERIKVMYRVGGGANTNIVAGAISTTKTYTLSSNTKVTVNYTNPNAGFGGCDEEDIDEAKLTAPISLRSANKTVTQEDYITHLEDSAYVMHATVYGKQNEPDEIYTEYGYYLPPLETWIYVCPERDDYTSTDPLYYNYKMKIGRPYDSHKILDSETITLSSSVQEAYLLKYRKYLGYPLYVTVSGSYTTAPYTLTTDFTFDDVTGLFTRVTTADGGSIAAGDVTLNIAYVTDSTASAFYTNTVKTFGSNEKIYLDSGTNKIYTGEDIIVKKANGTTCTVDTDYSIDYENSYIKRISGGALNASETVFIQYANNWVQDDDDSSEETLILDEIDDKKMICIDNVLKEAQYTTFDVVATIYCYKNLRNNVETNLKSTIQALYSVDKMNFNSPIYKSKIISDIMSVSGVRFVDITYLGTNYEAYRRYVLGTLTLENLTSMGANNVDNSITSKYNNIMVLAKDHYTSSTTTLTENQRSGLIFTYKDA